MGLFSLWAVLAITLACAVTLAGAADKKPKNVIWMLNDQENNRQWFPADWQAKNLHLLNKLEKNGIRFKKAYTSANMCSSARASMFTGQYNSQHQVTLTLTAANYQSPWETQLHPKQWNAGSILKDNGYDVVYFGKWHMSKGYFNATTGEYIHDDISRYGFGDKEGLGKWNGEPPLGTRGPAGFGGGYPNLDGKAVGNATAWITQRLKQQADGTVTKPFFMILSLWNPHDIPISFPGQPANMTDISLLNNSVIPKYIVGGYNSSYLEPTDPPVQLPPTCFEVPGIFNWTTGAIYWTTNTTVKPALDTWNLVGDALGLGPCDTPLCRQQYLNFYAQGIILADQRFDQFWQNLMALPGGEALINDTLIMKTADHGEMGMAHGGQRQKPFMGYNEAIGVNLVWSNPILFPKPVESDALVSHIDILPTMLDFLGINPKKYKLPGISYKKIFTDHKAEVQDSLLFAFNDHWATFGEVSPPLWNQALNSPSWPIANVSNGGLPGPNNLWVLNTKTHTAVIIYDPELYAAPEAQMCYDNTPTGGDYDATFQAPLQLRNLAPWAVEQRKIYNLPSVGTPAQLSKCKDLIETLRNKARKAFKPLPRFPIAQPEQVQTRFFHNTTFCANMCVEVLFYSQQGQVYSVEASINNGITIEKQWLSHLLMTVGDTIGVPYLISSFAQTVPGSDGPVYFIANVPPGTFDVRLVTKANAQRNGDINYRGTIPPEPKCYESCPWHGNSPINTAAIGLAAEYFQMQH